MLAEHFETSGILAAVAAGITMSRAELQGIALAVTRVRRTAVWDTVQFTLNGIIFVLLGEQLPRIASGAAEVVQHTGHLHPAWLLVYVLAVFADAKCSAAIFAWRWPKGFVCPHCGSKEHYRRQTRGHSGESSRR